MCPDERLSRKFYTKLWIKMFFPKERGMLPKGSRLLAKGGTRHLRFLIPPLATPPDLPLAAATSPSAEKKRGEQRFLVSALIIYKTKKIKIDN